MVKKCYKRFYFLKSNGILHKKLQKKGSVNNMTHWKGLYQERLCSAEQAVKSIPNNCRVVPSHAAGEPKHLVEAMMANREQYHNVDIFSMVNLGHAAYGKEEEKEHFHVNAAYASASTREVVNAEHGDFTPCFFYQVPELLKKDGPMPADVALIQVSLPDEHGYCSLGVSSDYTKEAAENAKIVIAQVNKYMPRTLGNNFVHVSKMTHIVEYDEPIHILNPPFVGETERKIGEYCASLIQDGDTLQLGIGAIPDAVLSFLTDKKHLGIHSEMISDGVVDLIEAGVIDNSRKNFNPGKSIVSFLMGTEKLYNYVHNNPALEMHPVDYVNHPIIAAQNDNLVSINSALQVDLMGQANSETLGHKQFTGIGGQVDFVRAASMSKGGRTIIAMPSTAAKGKISKIVFLLDEGAAVTTSRTDIDYVITEYGIAKLRGKSLRARAKALIEIAHPDFREGLREQALQKFGRL